MKSITQAKARNHVVANLGQQRKPSIHVDVRPVLCSTDMQLTYTCTVRVHTKVIKQPLNNIHECKPTGNIKWCTRFLLRTSASVQ